MTTTIIELIKTRDLTDRDTSGLTKQHLTERHFETDVKWMTLLGFAIQYDRVNAVRIFLENGADPNVACKGKLSNGVYNTFYQKHEWTSPLMLAHQIFGYDILSLPEREEITHPNCIDILCLLLEYGVNFQSSNSNGDTVEVQPFVFQPFIRIIRHYKRVCATKWVMERNCEWYDLSNPVVVYMSAKSTKLYYN